MNLVNLRRFLSVGTKLKESDMKQINSSVTTRTWVFSTEWTRAWPIKGLVLYPVNNDEDEEYLPFLLFRRHIVNAIIQRKADYIL